MKPYYSEDGITIYHGDCREVLPQLELEAVCITDPPYGIGRTYGDSYDDSPEGYWKWFCPCLEMLRSRFPLLAHTHRSIHAVAYLMAWDWIAVWHKPYSAGARIGNSPILPHWEPIFLYGIYKMGCDRDSFPDVISINPEPSPARVINGTTCERQSPRSKAVAQSSGHPLPKPTALMKFLISRLSYQKEIICDPFAGSGTTLVASKDLGRRAIGIEIEEKYCEIAAKRLAQKVFAFPSENESTS
jgi:site-specific DNA-methyltransferase (adenine-specific)